MNILSLFDGMSCGFLALQRSNIKINRYVAYEIDKFAVETSSYNFPNIEHKGDVFKANFKDFEGFDYLIGGSPCTYWSIAQTKNRETTASGLGWELFSQYVRALNEAKPKYFLYENNKSMSQAIRESISNTFGFEPICINSALVSAQNRQRLYWVGERQEDGSYRKVEIQQPEDRGILLKDILETGEAWKDKAHTIDANYYKGGSLNGDKLHQSSTRLMVAEGIAIKENGKEHALLASYANNPQLKNSLEKHQRSMVAEPICIAQRGRYFENPKVRAAGLPTVQMYEARSDSKTNTLTTVQKDNLIAEPFKVMSQELSEVYNRDNGVCGLLDMKGQEQIRRVYGNNGKAPTLTTCQGGHREPKTSEMIEAPTSKIPYYEVKNGLITAKGKTYPIKLKDGFYVIRKLTVRECMRLQTVPDSYKWPVSNSQAYKMLGNGWTVEVIAHLLNATKKEGY